MLDNENKEIVKTEQTLVPKVSNSNLPSVSIDTLDEDQETIIKNLIEAPTREAVQQQYDLFNLNQTKKNLLRSIAKNNLVDKAQSILEDRITKRPDTITNRELIDTMNALSSQIEKTERTANEVLYPQDDRHITVTNKTSEVNINIGNSLNRDEKEQVLDLVGMILKQAKQNASLNSVYQSEAETISENDINSDSTLYNDNENILNDEE